MKELTIEQKAKRYDEAIAQANHILSTPYTAHWDVMKELIEHLFPQFEESEDEKIRKRIIHALHGDVLDMEETNKAIAWLEKQGDKSVNIDIESMVSSYKQRLKSQGGIENSPLVNMCLTAFRHGVENTLEELNLKQGEHTTDKVKPKFHEGDWVVKGDVIAQILDVQEQYYVGLDTEGKDFTASRFLSNDKIHLWTIKDAKDGDILATLNHILIFEVIISKDGGVSYCHYDFGSSTPQFDFNKDDNWYFGKEAKVYPATKEQRDILFQKMKEAGYEWDADKKELEKIDQKSAIIIPKFKVGDKVYAIKDGFECTIESIDETCYYGDTTNFDIKDQDNWKLVEKKPVWSEEDEQYLLVCKNALAKYQKTDKWDSNIISQWLDNKLKSLRPQSTWKPSDEQMKQLGLIAEQNKDNIIGKELMTLYNDLKQL